MARNHGRAAAGCLCQVCSRIDSSNLGMELTMKIKLVLSTLILTFAISFVAMSQQKSQPEFKLVQFQMALLKRAPHIEKQGNANMTALYGEHFAYIKSLLESG